MEVRAFVSLIVACSLFFGYQVHGSEKLMLVVEHGKSLSLSEQHDTIIMQDSLVSVVSTLSLVSL